MEEGSSYAYSDQPNWDLNSDFNQIQEQQSLKNILTLPHSERGIAGFVSKLYAQVHKDATMCLQSNDSNPKYVRWCTHRGTDMFVIDCIPEFTKAVLPRLFKHCKFPSFVRQLNIYGFQRDTDARKSKDSRDKESCRWYHPYFRPNRRELFHLIRRKAIRYRRKKPGKSPVEDPDTIIPISEDEEEEESNQGTVIITNNSEHEFSTSSVSSVIQSSQLLNHSNEGDITQSSHIDTSNILSDTHESHHHSVLSENSPHNQENQREVAMLTENNDIISENETVHNTFIPPDETETYYMIQNEPFVRIQNLQVELHQLKSKFAKNENFLRKQLDNAHILINQQQRRIQDLEYTLNITKTVKQETQTGNYMNTMTNPLIPGNYIPIHAQDMNQLYTQQNTHIPEQQWLYQQQQQHQQHQQQQQQHHQHQHQHQHQQHQQHQHDNLFKFI